MLGIRADGAAGIEIQRASASARALPAWQLNYLFRIRRLHQISVCCEVLRKEQGWHVSRASSVLSKAGDVDGVGAVRGGSIETVHMFLVPLYLFLGAL